jgi:FixJ family two-component response regulator
MRHSRLWEHATRLVEIQEGRVESQNEVIYIVDDDFRVRESLTELFASYGRNVMSFASGREFLNFSRSDENACLILDLRLPEMSGLELQHVMDAEIGLPIIFITGEGDIPSSVTAMKAGAVEFLTKPINERALLSAVSEALVKDRISRQNAAECEKILARYNSLTPREREVLPLVIHGLLNKQAAAILGVTEYTIQVHRGRIMKKMQVDSFAELVRLATKLNVDTTRAF